MKLFFVDEFKEDKAFTRFYGIVLVCIDNSSYRRFKNGFLKKLQEIKWDIKHEIKGRCVYSTKTGDATVPVDERLNFTEKLFELSSSSSGKYSSAKVYYTFDVFKKEVSENLMYSQLLCKLIDNLPRISKASIKNGKNNAVLTIDRNNSIDLQYLSNQISKCLEARNYFMIEQCYSVDSNNYTPGIIFADHVAYFIQNYFKTSVFNENNMPRIKELISLLEKNQLKFTEQSELEKYMINIRKEKQSVKLLTSIKSMHYIE